MRAAVIDNFKGIESLRFADVPSPEPEEGEIQIAIAYAGVNPVDWKIAEGLLKGREDYRFPITLGWDLAGRVTKLGAGVDTFHIGEAVYAYCYHPPVHQGAFAEKITLPSHIVAPAPNTITLSGASIVPLSALTAWQAMFDIASVNAGDVVLIHAGSGGVGSFAIQLAKYKKAHVITTTSAKNYDYVRHLGADDVIDYEQFSFQTVIKELYPRGIDFILETVSPEHHALDYPLLKKGGWLISIVGNPDPHQLEAHHIFGSWHFVQPNQQQLKAITTLIDGGHLQLPTYRVMPFQEIENALRLSRAGHVQGKLTIQISGDVVS